MADHLNNSFIPKRGPSKRKRRDSSRQIYIFTLVSYVLMFSTLLAAGGVFFYGKHLDTQEYNEMIALKKEASSFSVADMQRVMDFDSRLKQAYGRLNNSVSVVSVFSALQDSTIGTVKVNSLSLTREDDEKLILAASIETDSFDSTIFQRGIYDNETIDSVIISELNTSGIGDDSNQENNDQVESSPKVTFTAELEVSLDSVLYEGGDQSEQPLTISNPEVDDADLEAGAENQIEVLGDNQDNI